jgi:hypothetical protein
LDGVGSEGRPVLDVLACALVAVAALDDAETIVGDKSCACEAAKRDGIDDLTLKFDTADLARVLELRPTGRGSSVELAIFGRLRNGTPFRGTDCVRLLAGGQDSRTESP